MQLYQFKKLSVYGNCDIFRLQAISSEKPVKNSTVRVLGRLIWLKLLQIPSNGKHREKNGKFLTFHFS